MATPGGPSPARDEPLPGGRDDLARRPSVRLCSAIALAGGLLLVAVSLLVTTSVLMRWLAGGGVRGDFELVQMATAVAAFAFLPLCQATRGNIIVDTFSRGWSRRTTLLVDALWDFVYAGMAGLLAWSLWQGARDSLRSQTTSMVLQLPVGYAIGATALLAAVLAGICVATALRLIAGSRS